MRSPSEVDVEVVDCAAPAVTSSLLTQSILSTHRSSCRHVKQCCTEQAPRALGSSTAYRAFDWMYETAVHCTLAVSKLAVYLLTASVHTAVYLCKAECRLFIGCLSVAVWHRDLCR